MLRVWIDWRWWLVGLALVLLGKAWPGTFFDADPAGTVRAQVWHVVLKVTGAYVLGVLCWLVAVMWSQTLVAGVAPQAEPHAPVESALPEAQ